MRKSLLFVYGILIVLTLTTAFIVNSMMISTFVVSLIMGLSISKFLLVAFQFMELKKANSFWKVSLSVTIGLIVLLIIFL
ncbi:MULTISPECIES: cytochrome C oxidase subunit IV family protein [Flavobacterium]|uniref:cytochrome C oxidase subunit IV family protein n=1 Tax=Flavobacterium TaxID=237 RepID=UPI0022AC66EF|nr:MULTISPECIES: cytochrome C oxidase subunit IV family protein [Flavobacterium]